MSIWQHFCVYLAETIPPPPRALRVSGCPERRKECNGRYALVPDRLGNGERVWHKEDGKRWIYLTTAGSWMIGGPEEEKKDFNCARGYVRSHRAECWPNDCVGTWELADGNGGWTSDGGISVSSEPTTSSRTARFGEQVA